jgi:hypothetical protein
MPEDIGSCIPVLMHNYVEGRYVDGFVHLLPTGSSQAQIAVVVSAHLEREYTPPAGVVLALHELVSHQTALGLEWRLMPSASTATRELSAFWRYRPVQKRQLLRQH